MNTFKYIVLGICSLFLLSTCEEPPVVFTSPQPHGGTDNPYISPVYRGSFICQSDSAVVKSTATTIYKEKNYSAVVSEEELKMMKDVRMDADSIYVEGWLEAIPYERVGDSIHASVFLRDTIFHLGENQRVRYFRGHQVISKKLDDLKWEVIVFSLDDELDLRMFRAIMPEELEALKEITPVKDISTQDKEQLLISPTVMEFQQLLDHKLIFEECDYFKRTRPVTTI